MELTYAQASAQDADAIFDLSKQLIDDYEDLSTIDYDKVMNWVRRKIDTHISQYRTVFLDGEKAGYFRFSPGEGLMELDDLYILPAFRGQGIGTAIVRKCCGESSLPVMLYVFTRNTGALKLYHRLGFRITEALGKSRCIMVRQPDREVL